MPLGHQLLAKLKAQGATGTNSGKIMVQQVWFLTIKNHQWKSLTSKKRDLGKTIELHLRVLVYHEDTK